MRASIARLTVLTLLLAVAAVLPAQEEKESGAAADAGEAPAGRAIAVEGEQVYPNTSRMRSGTLEPTILPALPREKLQEIDEATLKQLAKLQKRLAREGAHPEGPSLKLDVQVDVSKVSPRGPETLGPVAAEARATKAPDDFVLFRNTVPSTVTSSGFSSTVNEPSVAISGDTVIYTANWFAAQSDDAGATWTFLNPFTGPFATVNSGFCCDQVSVHHPGTNAVFYLQQYIEDGSTGTQRINVDQEADGTFDCFYDMTPQDMGFAANNWADFPDLAVSDDFVYHSSNVFPTGPGGFTGAFVARYPAADMASCGALGFDVMTDGSFGSFRFTRGARDTMYFADQISLSSMRIWTWDEGAGSPTSVDRTVAAWLNGTRSCVGPDGRDWCGFIDHRMMAGWVADGKVGFAWVPSQGGGFPYPYTRIAEFSQAGLTLAAEPTIWSADFAWVYPSVAVNGDGELGGVVLFGGGDTFYPGCAAFLVDEVNSRTWAPLENSAVKVGTSGPGQNRSGDYTWAQPSSPDNLTFAGACFGYDSTTSSTSHFVHFGREKNQGVTSLIFTDGFESGNTSAW